ncbi:MAG: bifunctional phosphoribosylaminoimidazolecarboxamide formyltransferase/IMP cyclohydrolase [Flavobacteriales bacterium]|nr:bifunctional phosphoribosylaminoimidazolecarboxamide formyltransferase/IMP cyclohydrolase [Flavobacteriales bacterium]
MSTDGNKKIQRALISVFDKTGLEPIVKTLHEQGVEILSTGGTREFVEAMGIPVTKVEDLTAYPSILGGRVKTLHPKVFGGILARTANASDLAELEQYQIPTVNLVIVDLYPFEKTVASTQDKQAIIEKIDIGGISLIRAAAKNHNDVLIVPCVEWYEKLHALLTSQNGETTLGQRRLFAAKAFEVSSHYDTAIFNWFNTEEQIPALKMSETTAKTLRYGENPHQKGYYFGDFERAFEQLNGKEVSYNNLLDIDAAVNLIADFRETAFAILKHNNACGMAEDAVLKNAYLKALAGDPVSAFGGVLITNRTIDLATAEEMNKLFFEVIIAPAYDAEALELLKSKTNRIILLNKGVTLSVNTVRTALNGFLVQERDTLTETADMLKTVTDTAPTQSQTADLLFAVKLVKHTKSNAIILVKDGQLVGIGTGHTSRIDALKHAIAKAAEAGLSVEGAVMASDAFFPFNDCVQIAHEAGVKAVIQPGGSVRDKDSVDYCNQNGLAMVMTGVRHFKH